MTDPKAMERISGRGGQQQLRWAPILANIIDNTDHYGNLVVSVRLNGMVPACTADSTSGSRHRPKRRAEVLSRPTETRTEGTGLRAPCIASWAAVLRARRVDRWVR
jgi:hypothetical protein